MENWKPVIGYEDLYMVSDNGNVMSLNYNHTKKPKLLTIKNHHTGYKFVMLCRNGKNANKTIHRLVAEAFIQNPQKLPIVNHKDGDKSNNSVKNLEWVTASENKRHSIDVLGEKFLKNRFLSGGEKECSKAVLQFSKDGTFINRFGSITEASNRTGVCYATISNSAHGKVKTRKYDWKFESA